MCNLKLKGLVLWTLLCLSASSFGQVKKPTISETKKWITEKLSLYAGGFTTTTEVRNPGVILGDRISTYEINKVTYSQSVFGVQSFNIFKKLLSGDYVKHYFDCCNSLGNL